MIHLPHYPLRHTSRRRSVGGFTLIELVVVIGIIALLISISVPIILTSYRRAKVARVAADLQAISTALEAYKTDFGDYPRVEQNNVGFAVLCKALISPGPSGSALPALATLPSPYMAGTYTSVGTFGNSGYIEYVCFGQPDLSVNGYASKNAQSDINTWAPFWVFDGKDGPGFKARSGGKAYGPYLQPEKFKLNGLAILDSWDNPILYFPAHRRVSAQSANAGPGATSMYYISDSVTRVGTEPPPVFEAAENISFFARASNIPGQTGGGEESNRAHALKRMVAWGVANPDPANITGVFAPGATQQPKATGPFMLWSAGADGRFGVNYDAIADTMTKGDIDKCDDVTNFNP